MIHHVHAGRYCPPDPAKRPPRKSTRGRAWTEIASNSRRRHSCAWDQSCKIICANLRHVLVPAAGEIDDRRARSFAIRGAAPTPLRDGCGRIRRAGDDALEARPDLVKAFERHVCPGVGVFHACPHRATRRARVPPRRLVQARSETLWVRSLDLAEIRPAEMYDRVPCNTRASRPGNTRGVLRSSCLARPPRRRSSSTEHHRGTA
jgi:hypothetical protein